jgi:predicted DCC family thiol-disulfide oxidoreductase YuxK
MSLSQSSKQIRENLPVLLYDDECAVCSRIAKWVQTSARSKKMNEPTLTVKPIGEDPKPIELLSPGLSIWDAYATIHLVMPDGQIKKGGEAIAEVFRNLPKTAWFAQSLSWSLFGVRPVQKILDFAYLILADIRPLLGCKSCGTPKPWVRPLHKLQQWVSSAPQAGAPTNPSKSPR